MPSARANVRLERTSDTAAAPANPLICAVEMIEIARMRRVREVPAKHKRPRIPSCAIAHTFIPSTRYTDPAGGGMGRFQTSARVVDERRALPGRGLRGKDSPMRVPSEARDAYYNPFRSVHRRRRRRYAALPRLSRPALWAGRARICGAEFINGRLCPSRVRIRTMSKLRSDSELRSSDTIW